MDNESVLTAYDTQFCITKEQIKVDHKINIMQKNNNNKHNYYNLLNDYDIKQFKYSFTSFETNLINYKFILNKSRSIANNKHEISQQKYQNLKLNEERYSRLNKINYFNDEKLETGENVNDDKFMNKFNSPQLLEENKEEQVMLNSAYIKSVDKDQVFKDAYDISDFSIYLNKENYFDYISVFLFMKYPFCDMRHFQNPNKFIDFFRGNDFDITKKKLENRLKDVNYQIDVQSQNALSKILNAKHSKNGYLNDFKEILRYMQSFNTENNYLKNFIHIAAQNLYTHEIYFTWKLYFGRLLAHWELNNKSGIYPKFKVKYLTIKILLEKIANQKDHNRLLSSITNSKANKINLSINSVMVFVNSVIEGRTDLPRLSFPPESKFIIFINILVDIQLVYFLFVIPLNIVLNLQSTVIYFTDQFFNGLYFFHLCFTFRTLVYDNMNNIKKNLNEIFRITIKNPLTFFDFISLIPIDIIFSDNDDTGHSAQNYYYYLKLFVLLRILRFGKTIEFLEKTKWALIFRLIVLLGKFIILIHWIGLYIFVFFDNAYSIENSKESCYEEVFGTTVVSKNCNYLNALYWGSYMVPGKNLQFNDFSEKFLAKNIYVFIFLSFFLGQIITAYVFSGVSDLIQSMNTAENKFNDIVDNLRNTSMFFKFDENVFTNIKLYYEYVWLRHREKIYGMEMFDNISRGLKDKLLRAMIPNYEFVLRDFILLNQKDNKFISILINLLEKYIAFPYERLYSQGFMIPGIFILYDGEVYLEEDTLLDKHYEIEKKIEDSNYIFDIKLKHEKLKIKRNDLVSHHYLYKYDLKLLVKKCKNIEDVIKHENKRVLFGVDSIFLKTARAIETCYVKDFCDLYLLPINAFDNILCKNYPNEMYKLRKQAIDEGTKKLANDTHLIKIVLKHSPRSVGNNYEKKYTKDNMWINIPLAFPILKFKKNENINYLDLKEHINKFGLFDIGFTSMRKLILSIKHNDRVNVKFKEKLKQKIKSKFSLKSEQ